MLSAGEWRATATPADPPCVGFHISGLYSPLGWLSWEEIARSWEGAQGNDASMKTLKNTILGETWAEKGEAPDWQRLYERRETWQLGQVQPGALVLTAGADVQRDRIEIDVWGWGRNLRSWLVDHVVLEGDTARPEVWADLSEFLGATWGCAGGGRMGLARLAIDTGDGVTTDAVYAWVRKSGRQQVIAVKGVGGFDRSMPVDGPTYVEVTEGGRKLRRGVQLWKVAGAVFKAEWYRFLRLSAPTEEDLAAGGDWPAGFVHIPRGTTAEWMKQATAEQLVSSKTRAGFQRLEWQQTRERNEALDCRVYARAAAWLMGIDRWDEHRWQGLENQLASETGPKDVPPAGQPNRAAPPTAPQRPATPWLGSRKKWF
jgi:phage terminase large subunit GpA-like protein